MTRTAYALCVSRACGDTTFSISVSSRVNDTGPYVGSTTGTYFDQLGRSYRNYVLNFSGTNWYTAKDGYQGYDVFGRVTLKYQPTDLATQTCCAPLQINYDTVGRVASTIDPNPVNYAAPGAQTTTTYASLPGGGAKVTITSAAGQVTERQTKSIGDARHVGRTPVLSDCGAGALRRSGREEFFLAAPYYSR